eukprot:233488-Alexandrium_andersonii.AAC.1
MSASLVGSEMCIRDSCSSSGLHPASLLLALRRQSRCRSSSSLSPHLGHCLLYTSDAADDM